MKLKVRTTSNPERQQRALVYFSTEQRRQVRALAKRHDISQAQIFRRGLDLVIAELSRAAVKVK
jgi:hypothetical protein